jgi:hypothetical protein
MFQGGRMILKGRVEIGLGGMTGVARLREKRKIRQFQVHDDFGDGIDRWEIGLPLEMGMGEHQNDEQYADTRQGQGRARFSPENASPVLFLPEESVNQGP